jgi:hypothetical protein
MAIPDIVNPFRNYYAIKLFLTTILFTWLIPLIMLVTPSLDFYGRIMKLTQVCVVIYVFFSIPVFLIYPEKSEGFTFLLGGGLPLLLITLPYHSKKKSWSIIISLLIVVVLMMLLGRRNKVVYYGTAFIMASIINIISVSKISRRKKRVYTVLLLSGFVGLMFTKDSVFNAFFRKMDTGMSSRELVIDLFIEDFNSHPSDWILGRGLFGQFDAGTLNTDDELELRDGIENGYLSLILKGGGVWILLLVLTAFPAMYKGFFKSKNLLCKGFSGIIAIYFIDMIGFGVPGVSLKYIMIFIAIGGCNTPWLRQCSDKFLADKIGLK